MSRPRILVLEPYASMGQAFAVILQRAGWDVGLCETDQEALRALRDDGYDVLLIDLNTRTGDGWHVLQTLASEYNSTPIIAMIDKESGQSLRARALGASIVLSKPVGRKRLLVSATTILQGA